MAATSRTAVPGRSAAARWTTPGKEWEGASRGATAARCLSQGTSHRPAPREKTVTATMMLGGRGYCRERSERCKMAVTATAPSPREPTAGSGVAGSRRTTARRGHWGAGSARSARRGAPALLTATPRTACRRTKMPSGRTSRWTTRRAVGRRGRAGPSRGGRQATPRLRARRRARGGGGTR